MSEENSSKSVTAENVLKKPEKKKYLMSIAVAAIVCACAAIGMVMATPGVQNNELFPGSLIMKSTGSGQANQLEDSYAEAKKQAEENSEDMHYFKKTDNDEINWEKLKSLDGYKETEKIDGVTFAYPKYMFNSSFFSDNSASFYYTDSDGNVTAALKVTKTEDEKDALEYTEELYNYYESLCENVGYTKLSEEVDSKGRARAVISGYRTGSNGEKQGMYVVIMCNGKKEYIMEYYYPDSDPDNSSSVESYSCDCLYRYCSFSGSSYKPRSFKKFKNGDKGTKK